MRVSHGQRFGRMGNRFVLHPVQDSSDALCLLQLTAAAGYLVAVCVGPLVAPTCHLTPAPGQHWLNPMYDGDPCLDVRHVSLGGLTLREACMARSLYVSLFLGALVGYERRSPDRPAGIRTMSLTSLGVACFTLSSIYAFQRGPMKWDSSRITADIPKGIGFLAGAVIYKGKVMSMSLGMEIQQVNGLTTATTMWLAAAIGAMCGGGLMSYAMILVSVTVLMLRFGPRNSELELNNVAEDQSDHSGEEHCSLSSLPQDADETGSLASRRSNPTILNSQTAQYLGDKIQGRATICTET